MIRAFSVDSVRRAESAAMADLPDGELMQRAATGLAEVVAARLEQRDGDRVVALVGSGDNGGDAAYAAARLAADGHNVAVVLLSDRAHEGGVEAARGAGCVVLAAESDPDEVTAALGEADVVVDCVTGIGGSAGLRESAVRLRDAVPETAYVVSVDLPSGSDPAGIEPGETFFADETVTFSLAKPVHLLPAGEAATGLLTVVEIGVEEPERAAVERLTRADIAEMWPVPGPFDDKYTRGVLGVVAGGERYPGAAVLATTAAATAGVGMVRYVGPPTPTGLVHAAVPEAVPGKGRVQAWLVGPGLDSGDRTSPGRAQLRAAEDALGEDVPCVVDAGALDLLSKPRSAPTLLTPHVGELARLAKRLRPRGLPRAGRSEASWVQMTRERPVLVARAVADRLDATVLVKGAVTVVVPPTSTGLPVRSQSDGPAWLATAGAGDVLAGLAGALAASGCSMLDTGSMAAAVHGMAADRANPGGPVRALDVAHALGRTVAGVLTEPA